MLSLLPTALQISLASLLWKPETFQPLEFRLRHAHSTTNDSRIVFADSPESVTTSDTHTILPRTVSTYKPGSHAAFDAARIHSMRHLQSESLLWDQTSVLGPDVTKRETLLQLAKMTSNSYFEPENSEWYDLGSDWNKTFSYGWEPDADGFRGHIFVSTDESTVVVSIKGTSVAWLSGGPTVRKDKLNDNLLFSCCCARVGPTWSTVCGCYEGGYKCDLRCLEQSLIDDNLFYSVGTNLYNNISYMYPEADIWVIGHSLGGSLAALVGATFGAPVVAFEAPAERMAARRLHLPSPPSMDHIVHVFHTADPIPMGQCNGITSACANGGYAMESQCHQGKKILYDTVKNRSWGSHVNNHPIKVIIESLLDKDWDPDQGKEVPDLQDEDEDCVDCFKWEIGDFRTSLA